MMTETKVQTPELQALRDMVTRAGGHFPAPDTMAAQVARAERHQHATYQAAYSSYLDSRR